MMGVAGAKLVRLNRAEGVVRLGWMMKVLIGLRQHLSWKLGYGRGRISRSYSCPWWADEIVFARAF